MNESPAVAQRRLRLALRRAREARGRTQAQVAEELDWSLSKVQRIESGDVRISGTDLKAMIECLEIDDQGQIARMVEEGRAARRKSWWEESRYRDHLTPATKQLLQFESHASAIRVFHPVLIPGIMQTRAYAEFVLGFMSEWTENEPKIRLEVRLSRRHHVLSRAQPPEYRLILDESVLHRELGGPAVMAEQLRELLRLSTLPHVRIRVAPLVGATRFLILGQFLVIDLEDEENALLYRENQFRDEVILTPAVVSRYSSTFELMWTEARDEVSTSTMIQDRAAEMEKSLGAV